MFEGPIRDAQTWTSKVSRGSKSQVRGKAVGGVDRDAASTTYGSSNSYCCGPGTQGSVLRAFRHGPITPEPAPQYPAAIWRSDNQKGLIMQTHVRKKSPRKSPASDAAVTRVDVTSHERDETVGMTDGQPNQRMRQGHDDLERGVRDTSRSPEAGRAYDKQKKGG
jgi:hypothetical protein